jgi:hypothetical protein
MLKYLTYLHFKLNMLGSYVIMALKNLWFHATLPYQGFEEDQELVICIVFIYFQLRTQKTQILESNYVADDQSTRAICKFSKYVLI